jgi:anaerobic nitric oxide reductase flavorubredoxin
MPNDAFGQHIATSERFDDEVDQCALMDEAVKYYANILWPLGSVIARKLEEVMKMGIPITMIAPSHGIIWRKDPMKIVNAYAEWVKNSTKPKVVIVYETMWNSTEKMARKLAEGVRDAGVSVRLYDIAQSDSTEIVKEMLDAKGFLIGSSTHDNDMLPHIAGFLELLKGFKAKGRIGAAFGSYGWAGGATNEIEKVLKEAGVEVPVPGIGIKYVPDEAESRKCYEYGLDFAKRCL